MALYTTSASPFREALRSLSLRRNDPPDFVTGYSDAHLTDLQKSRLQDWCSDNASPVWATGLSMIEAAELIVAGAVENGNIEPESK